MQHLLAGKRCHGRWYCECRVLQPSLCLAEYGVDTLPLQFADGLTGMTSPCRLGQPADAPSVHKGGC